MTDIQEIVFAGLTQSLGDRVARVQVELFECDTEIGAGITTPDGWRYAMRGYVSEVRKDPEKWVAHASDMLLGWIDQRERSERGFGV